jgi:hypothetical protein
MSKHIITINDVEEFRKGIVKHRVAASNNEISLKSLILVVAIDPDLMNGCALRYEVFNQDERVFTSQDLSEAVTEYNKYP